MKRLFTIALLVLSLAHATQASETEAIEEAKVETVAWLALTDTGDYGPSWDSASALFRAAISREDWEKSLGAVRNPIGALKSREMTTANFATALPGAPDGEYVVFQFAASFEGKATAVETVTAMKDADGEWRVAGYFIK